MEGELPQQSVLLSQVKSERESLLMQVDALSTKLANTESQFSRERTNSATLQVGKLAVCNSTFCKHRKNYDYTKVKVEELEEELHMKTDQLLHAFSRQNDLELEISSVRKDQQAAVENAAKLESDVCQFCTLFVTKLQLKYFSFG